jgi:COP9 signalosome complex subunit 3
VSKCYSAALPVLEREVDDVDPKRTAINARNFLLYGYYGGLIYIGKDFFSCTPA